MKKVISTLVVAAALVGCGAGGPSGGGGGGSIAVGMSASGTLGPLSEQSTIPGRSSTTQYRRDLYTISLTAGMPVTILMCRVGSVSFDPYVAIHGPAGEMDNVGRDDDSAGSLNSRLVYTPMTTGMHTLYATTFSSFSSSSSAGMYTLTVFDGEMQRVTCPSN